MVDLVLPPAMIETMTAAADWVLVLPLVLCLMGAAATLMLRRSGGQTFIFSLLILLGVIACETTTLTRRSWAPTTSTCPPE